MDSQSTTQDAPSAATPPRLLRSASFWSLEQLAAMDLVMVRDREAFKALPPADQNLEVQQLMWVHHIDTPEDLIESSIAAGTWREEFARARRNPRLLHALAEASDIMIEVRDMLGSPAIAEALEAQA